MCKGFSRNRPTLELLSLCACAHSIVWVIPPCFSKVVIHLNPTCSVCVLAGHSVSIAGIEQLLNVSRFDECVVLSHSFDLHFPGYEPFTFVLL